MMETTVENVTDKTLANILPDAMIALDANAKILWWNVEAKKLFFLEHTIHDNAHINTLLDKKTFNFSLAKQITAPIELTLPDRPKVHISVSLIPYVNQQFLLLAQNITHVYHLEKMRQDFLANVSHELRTPLTVIHGYLEILLEQKANKNTSLQSIFLQMHHQSIRMERLVNDLLLLSRLEVDAPDGHNFQAIAVAPLLMSICDDARTYSANKHHEIICDFDQNLIIYGIEDELRSAFSNLVINAVKYTPAKGRIYVHWWQEHNQALMRVTDTGIGIASDHIPRVTERFYRVDRARSRASGGTGLGLAIVKHVLLRHRAKLDITSELGKGSQFTCIFPGKSIVLEDQESLTSA
jgi:two-component system, OmpR family, phosphate regulon sensor histidine kinase PhoR